MRNIKDFQARYDRWKNGERYWDIRGVDLPRYDTGDKTTFWPIEEPVPQAEVQIPYNLDNQLYGATNTPYVGIEPVITAENKFGIVPTDDPNIWRTTSGYLVTVDRGNSKDAYGFVNPYNGKYMVTDAMQNENDRARKRYEPIKRDIQIAQAMGLDPTLPFADIANGQYKKSFNDAVNSLAWLSGPIGTAARTYVGGRNFASDEGVKKTINFLQDGRYGRAALSGFGDFLNLSMVGHGANSFENWLINKQWSPQTVQKLYNGAVKTKRAMDIVQSKFNNLKDKFNRQDYITMLDNSMTPTNTTLPIIQPVLSGNTQKLLEQTPYKQLLLPYINSWKNAVQPSGEIMPSEVVSKLRYLKEKYPNIFGRQVVHHREDAKDIGEYQSTLRHLYNAAKTAQTSPVPEGATKQQLVFAALTHDIGELLGRDGHGQTSEDLLRAIYPDVPETVLYSIRNHMSQRMPDMDPLTKGLHFADVASGVDYNKGVFNNPLTQYPQINMPTNIGKFTDENWQDHVTNILNPILQTYGYEPLDINSGYDNVRNTLLDYIKQNNTFLRGVRLITHDSDTDKAIEKTRNKLSNKLGRPITDEELRRHMVEVIPPHTGSGRRGQDSMRDAAQAGHDYGSLYYSNSNETGAGYGADSQKGKIYKSQLPLKNDPNMSLMDLWFANDFPLFSPKGKLNPKFVYFNKSERQFDPEKEEIAKWLDDPKHIKTPKIYNDFIHDEYLHQIKNRFSYMQDKVKDYLQQYGINFNYINGPVQDGYNAIRFYENNLEYLNNLRPSRSPYFNMIQPYRYDKLTYGAYKKLRENEVFKLYTNFLKYRNKSLIPELKGFYTTPERVNTFAEEYLSILDYINKHSSKKTKDVFDKYIKSKYSDDEFEYIMSHPEYKRIIQSDFEKFIEDYMDTSIDQYKHSDDNVKRIKQVFNKEYKKSKQRAYASAIFGAKSSMHQLVQDYKNPQITYADPNYFYNKFGIYPNIYTKEYLQHPIIYTTEGTNQMYNDRHHAQHYIIFGPKGKRIFDESQVSEYGKGGQRISRDSGDMDPNVSHKVYNRGKDGRQSIRINPVKLRR